MMTTRSHPMPEGDTIFRAARTLDRALRGEVVEEFRTVLAQLARRDATSPLAGRVIEQVSAAGKHLLIRFSQDLVLRTHLRMHGSWHIYRRGERWRRSSATMRLAILTPGWEAVGFNIPDAEFIDARALSSHRALQRLGPDLLADEFDEEEAFRRMRAADASMAMDVLLDQTVMAGAGNVFKSEILFLHGIHPETAVRTIDDQTLIRLLRVSRELLRANVTDATTGTATWSGGRRTTRSGNREEALWVYGRGGKPCRRCGTPIAWGRKGKDARSTYWCPVCQPVPSGRS